jgi:predicted acylesterase/phospholipase RssA
VGRIRIGLTISGAVSLGSFEGGALSALLTGIQALQAAQPGQAPPIRVDAIGAASAGALTAVAAARILTGGLEPTSAMEQAWVTKDTLQALMQNANNDAPLSMDGLSAIAMGILQGDGNVDLNKVQAGCDVTIHLALCNLRGLDYEIKKLSPVGSGSVNASTYLDWAEFTFSPNAPIEDFQKGEERSAVDTALASGSNEFGFPPKRLARSRADYEPQGLDNFPDGSSFLWFTDGGTIDNEPLGRTMDITNPLDSLDSDYPLGSDDHRIHLLIHPFPTSPAGTTSMVWADPDRKPTWLRTLFRAFEVIRSQNLYSDVRRAEKTNSRLVWDVRLQQALDDLIENLTADQKLLWAQKLQEVVGQIDEEVGSMPRHRDQHPTTSRDRTQGPLAAQLLHTALERVTGLSGKTPVGIEVISPYLAEGTAGLALGQILAGEFLESFGGFFDEGLRRSDFALGFVCMLNWMSSGLEAYGLDSGLAETATSAALRSFFALKEWSVSGTTKGFTGYGLNDDLKALATKLALTSGPSWTPTDFGEKTMSSLPLSEKWQLLHMSERVAKVVATDVWLHAAKQDSVGGNE